MGRFNVKDTENYGGTGGAGFFSLKNDGDIARVRFMYNNINDVQGYAVHSIEGENNRKRNVNCLRDYDEPVEKCPFCANHMPQGVRFYIPLYDEESKTVKIWERGKKFASKLSAICSRYASEDKPLVNWTFDIQRNGKAGDTQTTYEIFPVEPDDTTLEDLPEVPEILGGVVLDKSADEMNYYLDNGNFKDENTFTKRSDSGSRNDRPVGRRTPANRRESF